MRFITELSEQQHREILGALQGWDDPREVRRVRAIRMSTKGWTVPQIADALDVTRWTVRQWMDKYEEGGVDALRTEPRPGRPPKADQHYMDLLEETVQTPPRELGYPFSSWTREFLARHMERETGTKISVRHMGRLLKKLGFVYKRARYDLSHRRDPQQYEEKKQQLSGLKKGPSAWSRPMSCCFWMRRRCT